LFRGGLTLKSKDKQCVALENKREAKSVNVDPTVEYGTATFNPSTVEYGTAVFQPSTIEYGVAYVKIPTILTLTVTPQ
jgi:oxalate decarboxylase/phosphoglucose isomerase-like protein (cupin superfamily)